MIEFEYIRDVVVKNKIAIISILFGIASLVGSGVYIYFNSQSGKGEKVEVSEKIAANEKVVESNLTTNIKVDVKGAVKKTGVYELSEGSTILDALTSAGGVTSKGSTANINLSKKLTDEMVIYVFTKDELKKKESTNELVCEIPKCECETVTITECPSELNGNKSDNNSINTDKTTISSQKVSLNSGTLQDFTTLDGVGESKAQAIIDYREKNGPFKQIEDIMNVSGIGEKAFEKIKDKLTL